MAVNITSISISVCTLDVCFANFWTATEKEHFTFEKILVTTHYIDLVSGPTLSEKQGSNLPHEICK